MPRRGEMLVEKALIDNGSAVGTTLFLRFVSCLRHFFNLFISSTNIKPLMGLRKIIPPIGSFINFYLKAALLKVPPFYCKLITFSLYQ